MRITPIEVGMTVRSMAGRDEGRELLVIAAVDEEYVLIADGKLRTVEKPKKKKRRHLRPIPREKAGAEVLGTNARIRKWLSNEEEQECPNPI